MKDHLLRELLREYDEYRLTEEQLLRDREAEVLRKVPELARLRHAFISELAAQSRARILHPETTPATDPPHSIETLKSQENALLKAHGFPADYLSPRFRCPFCKDTGYVGDMVKEKCNCLIQRLIERTYRLSDITELNRENFETFRADIFPAAPLPGTSLSQREYMLELKERLQEYTAAYPENPKRNILFSGKTGLGKTFLLNCLAKEILDKGYTVLKITSYNLFEHLFRNAMGNMQDSQQLKDRIFSVDTLIIDDLGTETKRNNFTAEELFNILNERCLQRKHTFLSTNLTLTDIKEWYSDRVTSRLFDTQSTLMIRFAGQDVRLKPKNTTS